MNTRVVNTEMALISNALAAYGFIIDHPERTALYFMCGVCLGLLLTLLALVVQISCRVDCGGGRSRWRRKRRRPPGTARRRIAETRGRDSSDSSGGSDSDWDASSDLSARRRRRFERTLRTNVFASAEELERAQRLEERERIVREIWMNGQPDVGGAHTLSRYC
ncbi:protein eva-1 homolog A [Scleropages formosus]|uniref:Eva-1 homolog A, regulator of programmed cell death n=1 Tax=Scleropages formosus TaxID=113540 RepID=A0A8C9WC58_SCLFO|nr:protein eva-1 homolog A-like [Scleropages formosus]XP_029114610.1 protein eva-1 homolog A-like [Scleropages formosus]